jgi:alpha-beta hydrolase superfamily lysophospholipase
MQVEEYFWKLTRGVSLYGKSWTPDNPVRAVIIMIHGIGEHSGCYAQWAEKFVNKSYGFFAFDLRGHGRSSGKRGHASIKDMESDLKWVIKTVRRKYPKIPVILYGHSMGGQIALSYAIDKRVKVQGIVASSPWLRLAHPPSAFIIRLAKQASRIFPGVTVSTGIKREELFFEGVVQKSTKTDPLLHKKISLKLFTDLWQNSERILCSKHKLNVSLLLMHGKSDPLTSCQATNTFAQNSGKHTEFKQWNGMYHDLHEDVNNEIVFQYVEKWISRLVKRYGVVPNSDKMYRVA